MRVSVATLMISMTLLSVVACVSMPPDQAARKAVMWDAARDPQP
jgi:hypothetical protein